MKRWSSHGMSRSREYAVWSAMIQRCFNPQARQFKDYGGRGITVCEQWRYSFQTFLRDMGRCQLGLSLERRDNHGNYEPHNCYWADRKSQMNNTRRNRVLTFDGKTKTLAQWAECLGTNWYVLRDRLRSGWSVEKTFSTPTLPQHGRAHAANGQFRKDA